MQKKDIILLDHNIEPYKKLMNAIKNKHKACAIQPTGTGKMYLAIKWLNENPYEPFVYIAPTNVILNSFIDKLIDIYFPKQAKYLKTLSIKEEIEYIYKNIGMNLTLLTYTKLTFITEQEMKNIKAKRIVLDEFHHLGADKWGASVEKFLSLNKKADLLGLTATPIRSCDGKNMVEYLFDGEVDSEITLNYCFDNNILKRPIIINDIYSFYEEIAALEESIQNKKFSQEKMKKINKKIQEIKKTIDESNISIKQILNENLQNFKRPNGKLDTKLIVFCTDIEDAKNKMKVCRAWFDEGTKIKKYSVTYEENKKTINTVIKNFEKDNAKCVKLMFVVDMLNEGLHVKGVDGVVMLRSTSSQIVFLQQLGRALSVTNASTKSPVVFDLTNNIEVLLDDINQANSTGIGTRLQTNLANGINKRTRILQDIQELKSINYDFNDRISSLKEYSKQHGSIGEIKTTDGRIGKLIKCLRSEYVKGKLTTAKIKKLEKLGMIWRSYTEPVVSKEVQSLADKYGNTSNPDSCFKYIIYVDEKELKQTEIKYLEKHGVGVRQFTENKKTSKVREELKFFVDELNIFIGTHRRMPSLRFSNERELRMQYSYYTNPDNINEAEINYLQQFNIRIKTRITENTLNI